MLEARPLLLAAVSAVFLAGTLYLCIDHGWRLDETVGSGRRSGPLWVPAFLGIPFWSLGVVVGVGRAVARRRSRRTHDR